MGIRSKKSIATADAVIRIQKKSRLQEPVDNNLQQLKEHNRSKWEFEKINSMRRCSDTNSKKSRAAAVEL